MIGGKENRSWTYVSSIILTLLWTLFSYGLLGLSLINCLNRSGCIILLIVGIAGSVLGYLALNQKRFRPQGIRLRRFRKPFPLLYLICAVAALIGGAIHPPSNYDAFCYRIPRLLQWMSEGHWHWIHGVDPRMNFSATGYESMMLPPFGALHTLRFSYLINAVSFLLLPGLIFRVFSRLGVRRAIAARWMWIIPCASCFVMQAGSIGNDLPSCTLILASLMFALEAARRASMPDVMLSVLAASLATGIKASNIPLLLPFAICLMAAILKHRRLLTPAVFAGILAIPVSFLPIAAANLRYTSDWTGSPNNPLMLHDYLVGLAGNSILIGSAALVPAVFPQAESVNSSFNASVTGPKLQWIKKGFMDFRMTHPQLASEENSGLGLGVTVAILLSFIGLGTSPRWRKLLGLGGLVSLGFWVALAYYMTKLGNCGAPRLVSPYYAGLILLPLLLIRKTTIFRSKWWTIPTLVALMPIIPALICSPARPMLPMSSIVQSMIRTGIRSNMLTRMDTVYQAYANRSDSGKSVRELLPLGVETIGFAGTSGESQYSFWLPLGKRKVIDFTPKSDRSPPDASTLDTIVASHWGCMDRFGMTPEQLAGKLGWKVLHSTSVQLLASAEPSRWFVLVPDPVTREHQPDSH